MDRSRRSDALVAILLASLLSVAWAWRDWANLSILRLPDTDDVMRLQQVRDWLAGQRFGDLVQHRLAGGVPMHWSRLADLGPAAIVSALAPLLGRHGAELAAVLAWPALLFASALLLVGRITRHLAGAASPGGERERAATAMLVASIAYPATTIFLPGRIDHHGLQVVLLLGATLGMLVRSARGAAAAGACAGASLIVGLETMPLFAALGLAATGAWIVDPRRGADERLAALGVGALAALLAGRLAFAGEAWNYPACDGFTAQAWTAAMALVVAPVLLGGVGHQLHGRRPRSAAALLIGGGAAALALARAPGCLAPYGAVDPALALLWLARVGEAQSIASAPFATGLGYCGIMAAGLAATLWQAGVRRTPGWSLLALLLAAAAAVSMVQLRGAYAGAMLAAPGLAAAIGAARARGALTLAGAWAASAGMLYPLAAQALTPVPVPVPVRANEGSSEGDCGAPATLATLATLPPGIVLAPVDTGAWGIAATPHRFLAAPYHRDGAGMMAMYRFYAGAPIRALPLAERWRVDYVMACAGLPGAAAPGSAAAALAAGRLPGFHPVARSPDGTLILARDRAAVAGAPHRA